MKGHAQDREKQQKPKQRKEKKQTLKQTFLLLSYRFLLMISSNNKNEASFRTFEGSLQSTK